MTTQPLQGRRQEMGVTSEEPLLLIPGRPQSATRDGNGKLLETAKLYQGYVASRAKAFLAAFPLPFHPCGPIQIELELTYTLADELVGELEQRPGRWHQQHIPTAELAPSLILSALTGVLFTHRSQIQPLIVSRELLSREETVARYGRRSRGGCAVIRWSADD